MGKIYFISEAMHTPDTSDDDILDDIDITYETCFKIGFSKDLKKRLTIYTSDTPRFSVHFTIDNATEEDEKRLHKYFSKYSREDLNGQEWFVKNKEMVKFFREHKTIEEIRSAIPELKISDKLIDKYKKVITPIIYIMIENGIGYNKEEYKGKTEFTIIRDLLDKYITNYHYYTSQEEFIGYLKTYLSEKDIGLILSRLEDHKMIKKELDQFNSIPFYHDKMKFVCNLEKELKNKDRFNLFLNSIPISFKNYYTILGPEKCSACKYQKGEMEKAYQILMANQNINVDSEVYKVFKVGDRLTSSYIKEQLGKIYKFCDYQKTPKAIDIMNYFETKPAMFTNKETGKRGHGFELISKVEKVD